MNNINCFCELLPLGHTLRYYSITDKTLFVAGPDGTGIMGEEVKEFPIKKLHLKCCIKTMGLLNFWDRDKR